MGNFKKILALLLCFALSAGMLAAAAFAEEDTTAETVLTNQQAITRLRDDLINRVSSDSFTADLTATNPETAVYTAMEHVGAACPAAGDYLKYQCSFKIGKWEELETRYSAGVVYHRIAFDITFNYRMTDDQNTAAEGAFSGVYGALQLSELSTERKAMAIYRYLNGNVNYNPVSDDELTAEEITRQTGYGALVNHDADSLGIALAFYRLALMAGVNARVEEGIDPDGNIVYWNLVQIDGSWYILNAASAYSVYLCSLNEYTDYIWADDDLKTLVNDTAERYGSLKGDVNGDKAVNLQDLIVLCKYLAGNNQLNVNEWAADLDSDTYTNLKDLLMLKQQLANS